MCLGLTVPMVLFIGAELVSGNQRSSLLGQQRERPDKSAEQAIAVPGGTSGQKSVASVRGTLGERQHLKSLHSQSHLPPANATPPSQDPPVSSDPAKPRTPAELETIETDIAESLPPWSSRPGAFETTPTSPIPGGVQLSPQLETDQSIPGMNVGLETRKLDRSPMGTFPLSRPDAGLTRDPAASQIEVRLARIQQHLDQLTNTLMLQTQQKQQEQLQQTAQLMQQVQQSGRLQELERQLLRLQETADTLHASSGRNARSSAQKPAPGTTTKIYYPRHLSADELLAQITPMLTHGTGRANAAGVPLPPGEIARSGKNVAVNPPRLIVTDAPEVHVEIERQIRQLDVPPLDVALDARVYALTLGPDTPHGFDFSLLKRGQHPWVSTASNNGTSSLNLGILNGIPDEFVNDLERLSPLRTIATPRVVVPERQPADLVIGAPVRNDEETEGDPKLQQAAASNRLRIRPFRAADGIRLEISRGGFAADTSDRNAVPPDQIVVHHGRAALVSGLIETRILGGESDTEYVTSARRERIEYIVVLTPSIAGKTTNSMPPLNLGAP